MTDPTDQSAPSKLDPTAPSFSITSSTHQTTNGASDTTPPTPLTNGQSKVQKMPQRPKIEAHKPNSNDAATDVGAGVKLSGAELKKQKAAEKAARRAEKIAEKGQTPAIPLSSSQKSDGPQRRLSAGKRDAVTPSPTHKRTGSMSASKILLAAGKPGAQPSSSLTSDHTTTNSGLEKKVTMFEPLYPHARRITVASASKEIHPAVLSLGLQFRDFVICGSTARTVATLLVFKRVITSYTTPPGTALSRNLTLHLSHQIGYLTACRPLCVSQGNGIRWLKKLISQLDPDLGEKDAKAFLCESVDLFLRERVTLADELIVRGCGGRVGDGDVVLTFGKSSVVEKALVAAWEEGKRFKSIVVDSRPLFEGRNMARRLAEVGVPVQYCLLNGLANVVEEATICILGASAMLGNGRLLGRAGTAMVAMMAKEAKKSVPVVVLCQSIKFTTRVALGSGLMNEIGDADSLVETEDDGMLTTEAKTVPTPPKGGKKGGLVDEVNADDTTKKKKGLEGWRDLANLQLLHLMYDLTPVECLDLVIVEQGNMLPSAVPVVSDINGGDE